jgi:hypothetical protein
MLSTLTVLLVALATPTLGLPQFVAELLGRQEVGNLTGGSVWAWRYPGPGDGESTFTHDYMSGSPVTDQSIL